MTEIPFSDGTGVLLRHENFPSQHIPPRNVDVWLPPHYHADPTARFPVLYMHDGQNLFHTSEAFGGVDWGIDEAITRLVQAGKIPDTIVVGVWNSPQRWRDYMPQKPLETPESQDLRRRFIEKLGGPPVSNAYLKFLVEEVKPFIDSQYRTLPGQPTTSVMGSSMGGLISLYALVEYPNVFGGTGCVSTHWPGGEDIVLPWLGAALPKSGVHRLYFDFGTETLDWNYEGYQQKMDAILAAAGYTPGRDWLTRKFPGAEHNEASWRARVDIPLEFLLG